MTRDPHFFTEALYPAYRQSLAKTRVLADERSAFQRIEIFDTEANGRVLALDGVVQITTRDEAAYAEMLAHLPMLEHGAAATVLVVGGGDGSIAEECLKHPSVQRLDMAEIDPGVIDLCKAHFQTVNAAAFADPRLRVHIEDAAAFLARPEARGAYDLVIADRPDPQGPAGVLFQESFYRDIAAALRPGGIAVFQCGVPFYQPDELAADLALLRRVFTEAGVYLSVVPTYVGGYMALTWASNDHALGAPAHLSAAEARFEALGIATEHYTPALHRAAFALPAWIARLAR